MTPQTTLGQDRLLMVNNGINRPQAFKIGDAAIIGIPGERFSNLGIEARRRSKAGMTFYAGYANDMIGYIPIVEAFRECENVGYEKGFGLTYCCGAVLSVSVISKEGIAKLTSSGIELVNQLASRKTRSDWAVHLPDGENLQPQAQ